MEMNYPYSVNEQKIKPNSTQLMTTMVAELLFALRAYEYTLNKKACLYVHGR
jgi:hypothetical protein